MHHMYLYEHHMVVMKGYVHNRAHPEGSMIDGYTTKEVIECYVDYIRDGKPIGVSVSQHQRVCEAHFSIIYQLAVMRPYIEKHL
jgi:hypothetical protein